MVMLIYIGSIIHQLAGVNLLKDLIFRKNKRTNAARINKRPGSKT